MGPGPDTVGPGPKRKVIHVIEPVREVCVRLCAAKPKALDLAGLFLGVVEDPGKSHPLVVKPFGVFRQARIPRDDAGLAEAVEVVPPENDGTRLPHFRKAFGSGREVPMLHPQEPIRFAFSFYPDPKQPAACTIFVSLKNDGGSPDNASVLLVTLPRDPK